MMKQRFLIRKGFRHAVVRLWSIPKIKLGIGILLAVFATWFAGFSNEVGVALGLVPFVQFDKTGLEGDNLKLVNDLEQRMKVLPKELQEQLVKGLVDSEFTTRMKKFEGLDEPKIAKIIEMIGDDDKGVRAILLKQGEELTKLKMKTSEEGLSIRSQIQDWATRNKEVLAKIKSGVKADLEPLEIRAANSPMTPANTLTSNVTFSAGSVIRMGGEVFDIRRVTPTFWDYLPKGRTGLENLPWVNKKVPASSGAAAFIGPGVAKPGVSFTLDVENSTAKKIAVSLKTVTELLEDVDGFQSFIQTELAYQLDIATNTQIMSGAGSSTLPTGVQTFSLPFTTSGLSTPNPNNWDCCRAVIAQIRKAFINSPVVIFLNPIDTANMDMDKAISQGTYLGLNARPIPGGIIVEDNNITVGQLQAIAIDCQRTSIYRDFILRFGWENDDFTKNLVTAIAERRFHFYHSANDVAGFVYDDLADIKSQIAAA